MTSLARCDDGGRDKKHHIGHVSQFPPGSTRQVQVGQESVFVSHRAGNLSCTSASCPHYSGGLLQCGTELHCPRHGASFNLETGAVIRGPCTTPVQTFPISITPDSELKVDLTHKPPAPMAVRDPKDSRVFLIVGGGAAGAAAAEELRTLGFTGRLVMFTREKYPPYDRPLLTKSASVSLDDLLIQLPSDCEVWTNTEIVEVDDDKVTLFGGEKIPFTKALICTGAKPRQLPGLSGNVHAVRSFDDFEKLKQALNPNLNICIVGSSFVGMEIVSTLLNSGCRKLTIVASEELPFERTFGKPLGRVFARFLIQRGITYIPKTQIVKYAGNVLELSDGRTLPCDLVVVGAGATPNVPSLKNATLRSDGSVETVGSGLNVAGMNNVHAAGDCATVSYKGNLTRIEHWSVAMNQARSAARAMLDQNQKDEQEHVPFFWTHVLGKAVRFVGHLSGMKWTSFAVEGDMEDKLDFIGFYVDSQGMILAAVGMGEIGEKMIPIVSILMNRKLLPSSNFLVNHSRGPSAALEELFATL